MKWSWLVLAVLGCADEKDGEADCNADGLSGTGEAMVDTLAWTASGGSWSETGEESIQITLESDLDIGMNLRGIRADSGGSVVERIAQERLPFVVDLSGEDGTGSVADRRAGFASYASSQPGGDGSMSILSIDDSLLTVCFNFDAVSSDGVIMRVRGGKAQVNAQ